MPRVLYSVSPIGLGHASRAAAVGKKLLQRGVELRFTTGGPAVTFLRSYGFVVDDVVSGPVPFERGGEIQMSGLWYLRYWFAYRSSRSNLMRVLEKYRPDLVVGDEEFSSLTSALGMKVPAIMISDELELGFARTRFSRRIEGRVATWYKDLQSRVQHVLVPDFGKDGGNLRHVGPIVRERTRSRTETLQDLELPAENKLILVSMSGSGLGRFLVDRAVQAFEVVRPPKTSLLVTGEPKHGSDHRYQSLGFVRDNQDVVAAADLCITLAGKSTIDEALNFGTPLIPIPLKGHFEQEKNARELGFEHGDLSRIEYYLDRMLAHRDEPKFFRGAELTADFIAESA